MCFQFSILYHYFPKQFLSFVILFSNLKTSRTGIIAVVFLDTRNIVIVIFQILLANWLFLHINDLIIYFKY